MQNVLVPLDPIKQEEEEEMVLRNGRPLKFKSGIELYTKIEEWKVLVEKENRQPTLIGLAEWLNVAEDTLRNYSKRDAFSKVLAQARAFIERKAVEALFDKNKPTAGVIFYLSALDPQRYALATRQSIEQKTASKIEIRIRKD